MKRIFLLIVLGILYQGVKAQCQVPNLPAELQTVLSHQMYDMTTDNAAVDTVAATQSKTVSVAGLSVDTLIGYKWDFNTQAWRNNYRMITNFDATHKPAQEFYQYWKDSAWQQGLSIAHIYDANGNRTDKTVQFRKMNDTAWTNVFRQTWTYNQNNQQLTALQQYWDFATNVWADKFRQISVYDAQNLVADSIQWWNHYTNVWANSKLVTYLYTNNLNTTLTIQKFKLSQWVNTFQYQYQYNELGNKTQILEQVWNKRDNVWANSLSYTYLYDANNNFTDWTSFWWSKLKNTWINSFHCTMVYDANNNMTDLGYQRWAFFDSTWVGTVKYNYTFDENGEKLTCLGQLWDKVAQSWKDFEHFTWSHTLLSTNNTVNINTTAPSNNTPEGNEGSVNKTGVTEINAASITVSNPYILGSKLKFNGLVTGVYTANIYDLTGKIVYSNKTGNNSFAVNNLQEGKYILVLKSNNNVVFRTKLVVLK